MNNYDLRMTNYNLRIMKFVLIFCVLFTAIFSAEAQSINQSSPTPITTNEISGKIPARDLGDARLTSYFYTFDGGQGDIFINVVTSNLNGDIDVFTADNLRPLTKITIYADASDRETGRVIYLRQPAKLILRIEGRTPNDDPAMFRIKFAGSFSPSPAVAAENAQSETPEVKSNNQTDIRVNSVGTIIEVKPKPLPTPKAAVAKKSDKKSEIVAEEQKQAEENIDETEKIIAIKPKETKTEDRITITIDKNTAETSYETLPSEAKSPIVATDEIEVKEKIPSTVEIKKDEVENTKKKADKNLAKEETNREREAKEAKISKIVRPLSPAVLENIHLIVLFKDGSKIERAMSDVLKVGVDKGILTIISKDGAIGRYSILEVEKMTIE